MIPLVPQHFIDVEALGWVHAGRLRVLRRGRTDDVAIKPCASKGAIGVGTALPHADAIGEVAIKQRAVVRILRGRSRILDINGCVRPTKIQR